METPLSYFDDILAVLENSIHPEVYHFRKGNHPGKNWYLKTVCPMPNLKQVDHLGFGSLWQIFSETNPSIARLVPHAYDWQGREIPYCASIWVKIGMDVILAYSDIVGFQFDVVTEKDGQEYYIDQLMDQINDARIDSKFSIQYPHNELNQLDEIEQIAGILKKNTRVLEVDQLKNSLKVIAGGKQEN